MELGIFSISLAVSDLQQSAAFYAHLGFTVAGGDADNGWLILRQGDTVIGLFHGMFEHNMMTFNPGWGPNATALDSFTDVRDIQAHLRQQGIEPAVATPPD
ncbi:MAG: VOC family protein, partial [Myxococcota bacterium]